MSVYIVVVVFIVVVVVVVIVIVLLLRAFYKTKYRAGQNVNVIRCLISEL